MVRYRFFLDNLSKEEQMKLIENIEKVNEFKIHNGSYIDCFIAERSDADMLISAIPNNVKYEKIN